VLRVGGAKPRKVDVRVVAATNRVLRDDVAAGRFRDDLFFRLNVIPVQLTPLRERPDDILPLAEHFLARHVADTGRRLVLSAGAREALSAHAWPGNVREIENVIERAVVLARGPEITPEDMLLAETLALPAGHGTSAAPARATLQEHLDRAAAERVRSAVDEAGGNRAEAARSLGIDRTTLYRTMKRLGLV